MKGQNTKIMSWNVGYLLGYGGSFRDYILNSHRALTGSRDKEEKAIGSITQVIEDRAPEIVCLQEVDTGSFRTTTENQIDRICSSINTEGQEYRTDSQRKYDSKSVFSSLPIMKDLGNGILYRGDREVKTHHLDSVSKNLVHEVELDDKTSLFSVHAPLREAPRQQYLKELGKIIKDREEVVICGDFNCPEDMKEIKEFATENSLEVHYPGSTFPACKPEKDFDLLLRSKGLDVGSCNSIDVEASDHLPIEAEIKL